MPPHFRTVWRSSYTKPLSSLGKNKLRAATQYLTGHCELNYHLNKYKPHSIPKLCPHCNMEEETMNHFIGQYPMWFYRRGRYFNCYYASVSEIADNFSLQKIVGYICSTNRFNQPWLVEARTTQSTRNILPGRAKGHLGLISQWRYTCATIPQRRRRRGSNVNYDHGYFDQFFVNSIYWQCFWRSASRVI